MFPFSQTTENNSAKWTALIGFEQLFHFSLFFLYLQLAEASSGSLNYPAPDFALKQ
jgi:hypothetical protein